MCLHLLVAGKHKDNSFKATQKYHDNSTSSTEVYNHTKAVATSLMVNSDVMTTMDNTVVHGDPTSVDFPTAIKDTDDTTTAELSTAVKDTDDNTTADLITAIKDTVSFAAIHNSSTQIF